MDDTISRQAAISAICNACGKIDCDKMDKCEKLQLPPANCSEFPNNSDTISRQAAIDAAKHAWAKGLEPSQYIELLPPVQPKHGKWIERGTWSEGEGMGETYGKYWECDQCGREVKGFWNECGNNFCSNCGADMRERGEAE